MRRFVVLALFVATLAAVALVATSADAQGFRGNGFRDGRRGGFGRGNFFRRPAVVFVQPRPQFFAPQPFLVAPRPPRHVVAFDQFGRPIVIHNHGFGRRGFGGGFGGGFRRF